MKAIMNFLKDEEGVTMVEYALMAALIAIVCITAVSTIGTNSSAKFTTIATQVGAAGS